MNIFYFAHNGVDHATQAEATAHNSNTFWIVLAASLLVAAVLYIAYAMLNKRPAHKTSNKKDKHS